MSKVWFVTGAGSGIGAATVRAALKAGDLQALDGVSTTELPGLMQTSSVQVFHQKSLGQ